MDYFSPPDLKEEVMGSTRALQLIVRYIGCASHCLATIIICPVLRSVAQISGFENVHVPICNSMLSCSNNASYFAQVLLQRLKRMWGLKKQGFAAPMRSDFQNENKSRLFLSGASSQITIQMKKS